MTVSATVFVWTKPEWFEESAPAAAFAVADAQLARSAGETVPMRLLEVGDVVCRGELARAAIERVHVGDRVIVMGRLESRAPLDRTADSAVVLLAIHASHLGIALPGRGGGLTAP